MKMINQERMFYLIFFLLLITIFTIHLDSSFAQPSTSILNSQPELIKILISNLIVNKSPSGFVSVTGTVQNNSTEEINHILVNITFFDVNNDVGKEISRFVSGPFTIYEPNSTERFSFIIGKEDYEHYEANAFANKVIRQ